MIGVRPQELIFMLIILGGATVCVGGVIYVAVRLALKHERKNSG